MNLGIDEGILRWLGLVERMENEKIAKRVYVRKCTVSVGMPWKRWINTVKDCLMKRGLDDRIVWREL